MPMYYIKDLANGREPIWSEERISTHKQDLKPERDRLNKEYSSEDKPRFVIGEMR